MLPLVHASKSDPKRPFRSRTRPNLAAELGPTYEASYRALAALRRDQTQRIKDHALQMRMIEIIPDRLAPDR